MLTHKNSELESAKLVYNHERHRLELQGCLLQSGDWLEVYIFGHWVPGQLGRDQGGWYLLTLDQVGIRLRAGLKARFCETGLCVA